MIDHKPVELRIRIAPELLQRIKDMAEDSFRSMSAEAAFRLQRSFERERKEVPAA